MLSGMATGASWLCYFKALQLGNINKVVPIDKLSIILTILFAFFFLGEAVSLWKAAGLLGIAAGTLLMIQKREDTEKTDGIAWLIYALLSALFASLTSIFGKIGITEVESNLGTALRTCVVLIMAWLLVLLKGKQRLVRGLPKRELYFILLSGIATGASWLCYYKALKEGPVNAVAPIDKLSILVTIGFSRMVFHERLSKRGALGLLLIVVGTLLMLIK